MVANIRSGNGFIHALNYNEIKINCDQAELLVAHMYHKEAKFLTFNDKLIRLVHQAELKPNAEHRCLHISLNLSPDDTVSNESFEQIATEYLQKIGFAGQPYLLYRHHDTNHPHCHIVTTSIRPDGSQINLHNLGKTKSFQACRELETKFNLKDATKQNENQRITTRSDLILTNGNSETRAAIRNLLIPVLEEYSFSSFPELNAILGQFNLTAHIGAEGSLLNKRHGVIYSFIDGKGTKIGKPIKSSTLRLKAGYDDLIDKFAKSVERKSKHKNDLKSDIEAALLRSTSKVEFIDLLGRKAILGVFRLNKIGEEYGLTFVDNRRKLAFNGSDISRKMSCKNILDGFKNPHLRDAHTSRLNEIMVNTRIENTKYDSGYKEVISSWAQSGFNIEKMATGYTMRHSSFPRKHQTLLPINLQNYLRANKFTKVLTNQIDRLQELSDYKSISLQQVLNFVFQPVSDDAINSLLLKESSKKKRKRRDH